MEFFKKIIYFLLSVQEKILTHRLNRTIGIKHNTKRKKFYSDGCFLSIDSLADSDRAKMEEELSLILKSCNYEPEQILEYIKKHGTKVFYIQNSKNLNSIGENEGFIYPQKGTKALYLALLTSRSFAFKTPEMFVLTKGVINKFYFIYQFYNWYAFKHNIEGLDTESQELLKKYLFDAAEEDFSKLQLSEIYQLKDAIKQDKSAIEFVFKLCQKTEGAQNAFSKMKDEGTNI